MTKMAGAVALWGYVALGLLVVVLMLCGAAHAQQAVTSPDLGQLRENMLSSEARYYLAVAQEAQQKISTMTADAAKTAAWWAEYVKGLTPKMDTPK